MLVDAGLSLRQIERRLRDIGASMENVRALLVSHEHDDHVRGLPRLMKRYPVTAYMTKGTFRALPGASEDPGLDSRCKTFRAHRPFQVGPWTVRAFPTPHDAEEPVGFVLEADGIRLGIATDMGEIQQDVVSELSGVHGLVLEFNHDPEMLATGPYPEYVKARIASPIGHLANGEAGEILRKVAHEGLRSVVLAHLSENNNEPELARSVAQENLAGRAVRIEVAAQRAPSWFGDLNSGGAEVNQLNFPMA